MASVLFDRRLGIFGFPSLHAIVILLLFALLIPLQVLSQDRLLPVFYFRQVKGLSTNEIRSNAVRDAEGFVWIGTLNGLCRWDGYSVKEYRNDPNEPHSISSNIIRSLLVDRKGRLWAGTYDTGLILYDPRHDRFINFLPRHDDSSWYSSKYVYSLHEDRLGNIWLNTMTGGLVRVTLPPGDISDFDSLARGVRFTTYLFGTPGNDAPCMVGLADTAFLVGTSKGPIVLDIRTRMMSRLHWNDPIGHHLDSLYVQSMYKDPHGNFWLGTAQEGLFRIDRESMTVRNYRHRNGDGFSLKSDHIYDIVEGRHGNLWIGSGGGVDLFSPSTGMCIPYLTIGSRPAWPSEFVRMSFDRDGVLWVGTMDGGLHWLSQKTQRFPLYGLRDNDGLSPIPFTSVDRDKSGRYWLMSSSGVLYRMDLQSGIVLDRIDVLRGKKPSYNGRASFIDRRGRYWYGVWGLGMFQVDLESRAVKLYGADAGLGAACIVNGIAQGEGDTLLVAAMYDGLLKFAPSTGRFIKVRAVSPLHIYSVMRDHAGRIWVGSELNGLTVLDPAKGQTEQFRHDPSDPRSLSNDNVRCIYEDSSGTIWIGSGNEINLWDAATHSFIRLGNPGFSKAIFADPIGYDLKGRLWISYAPSGMGVLDPSTRLFQNFDLTDGIDNNLKMVNLPDGRMILPSWSGVNIFHPDSTDAKFPLPPLLISEILVNDEWVALPRPFDGSYPLRLSYTQNVLEFEFAAIDIDTPELVEYRYVLEGVEREWAMPKKRRYVRHPGLSPGDYVFKVSASPVRRTWPSQEIALAISIAPPWWRTAWAYAAYSFFVVSLLYAVYRLRLRQIHLRQTAEMEHFQAKHLAEVDQLVDAPQFFGDVIQKDLENHRVGNYKERTYERELRTLGVKLNVNPNDGRKYEIYVYDGFLEGRWLRDAGVELTDKQANDMVEASVWVLDNEVIRAELSPWVALEPEERIKLYHVFIFEEDGSQLLGNSLPDIIRDSQMGMSAATRMLMDNASISCGPNMEVNVDLLEASQDMQSIQPYKIWYREGQGVDAQYDAVRPIKIDSHIDELSKIIEMFRGFADMETFINSQTQGDMQ